MPVPRTSADLNGFEGQFVTLFRQLTPDEQHDALIALNKAIQGTYRKPKQDRSCSPRSREGFAPAKPLTVWC
jgi:hypothetical protein